MPSARESLVEMAGRTEAQALQLLVGATPSAVLMIDRLKRVVLLNKKAEELLGGESASLLGLAIEELIPGLFRAEYPGNANGVAPGRAAAEARAQNEANGEDELVVHRRDGSLVPVEVALTPIETSAGLCILLAIADATQRKQAARDLLAARESLSQLNKSLEQRVLARTEELQAANARLEALAVQLQTAQRIAQVGSGELEVATGRVTWSEELYRIMGLDPSQPAPSVAEHEQLFAPESWARLKMALESAAAGELPTTSMKLFAVRSDGLERNLILRLAATRNAAGQVERVLGTLHDVTGIEQTTAQLEELAERLQLATSAAKLGVWDWDVRRGKLFWDETMMHHLYEADPHHFRGMSDAWRSCVHPDDRASIEAVFEHALAREHDFSNTFRIITGGGQVKHLREAATIHRDETGAAVRVIGVSYDITEQREAELALQKHDLLQRAILEHVGSVIIATTPDGIITLFNRAGEELLGYSAAEVVGQASPVLFHDASEIANRRGLLERELNMTVEAPFEALVIKTRTRKADTNEWTYVRKNGSRVPVLITFTSLRDEEDNLTGFLVVALDLSHHKQQEGDLLELNRILVEVSTALADRTMQAESESQAKSTFVANVSHEIRTPLAAITGVTYLLNKTPLSNEQKGLLLTIERSAKTLLGMINDILDLSKIEAQQLTLEPAPFSVAQMVEELSGFMAGYAVGKDLDLFVEADPALPDYLLGDRVRVMQILTNLAGNAIKFTEKGAVRASLRRTESDGSVVMLRLGVKDTGPGIDPEWVPKLFERFTQAQTPRKRFLSGTGLGLAIVKQLVTMMKGRFGVETELGAGSEFWCELPLGHVDLAAFHLDVDSASGHAARRKSSVPRAIGDGAGKITTGSASRTASSPVEAAHRLAGVRILVVDDADINRDLAARILGLEGALVTTAENGHLAIEMIHTARDPYDIVLMDVQMPDLDGIEAVRRIRPTRPANELPILAVTAGAQASERLQALEAGMDDFIAKPFDPEKLIVCIRQHVERVRGKPLAVVSAVSDPPRRTDWPVITGIDTADARARVSGDAHLFRSLLKRLLTELNEFEGCIDSLVRAKGPSTLAFRLHKLRGVSGNLGARALHRLAGETEAALRSDSPELVSCIRALLLEMERVRGAVKQVVDLPSPHVDGKPAALEPGAVTSLLRLLREQHLEALSVFAELKPALETALGNEPYARLLAAMGKLDFSTAVDIVSGLDRPTGVRSTIGQG